MRTGSQTRGKVGFMSQSFSLYTELTVRQNLVLHARLFHLPRARIAGAGAGDGWSDSGSASTWTKLTEKLPLGVRQRLALAVAVIHGPEMLILDEPTSGVDPVARDRFWELLIDLSRNRGVTIFVSTHFMNEAQRCDRVSLMHAGKVLAQGTPAAIIQRAWRREPGGSLHRLSGGRREPRDGTAVRRAVHATVRCLAADEPGAERRRIQRLRASAPDDSGPMCAARPWRSCAIRSVWRSHCSGRSCS